MEDFSRWPLLATVNRPADIRQMDEKTLAALTAEIRDYLVYRVGENGGHLASNLGAVELTLAIHRVFDAPGDHIIFDVGHQSYVHKLLTGRRENFDTLRKPGGVSGFPRREESEYDAFGTGHSSTAVSAAIGMAEAEALSGGTGYTVAVVGDGALTGGLSYEGLNNCRRNLRLIIVINENEMSISPNTGRLSGHLSKLRASRRYIRTKEFTASTLRHIPLLGRPVYKILRRIKRWFKHLFYRENLFEHMGIRYLGPIDGNDEAGVETVLRHAKKLDCSVIVHVKTRKGKGYAPAEVEPDRYHGLAPAACPRPAETFSGVCGDELCKLAGADARVVAVTAAMASGTGLIPFQKEFPRRFFDVGIAEAHAVTFAAGLAAGGMRPAVAVYSTFLQRAYDSILHDVAIQKLPVLFCVDRAGLNACDGVTHHGAFDVSMFAAAGIPVYAPVTFAGLRLSLQAALQSDGPVAVRYPSGAENTRIRAAFYGENDPTDVGVRVWQSGAEEPVLTIVTHGRAAAAALDAATTLAAGNKAVRVLLCEYLSPYQKLAAALTPRLAGAVLFFEEEIAAGGFGENLAAALGDALQNRKTAIVAAKNVFDPPAAGETPQSAAGVDAAALTRAAEALLAR